MQTIKTRRNLGATNRHLMSGPSPVLCWARSQSFFQDVAHLINSAFTMFQHGCSDRWDDIKLLTFLTKAAALGIVDGSFDTILSYSKTTQPFHVRHAHVRLSSRFMAVVFKKNRKAGIKCKMMELRN